MGKCKLAEGLPLPPNDIPLCLLYNGTVLTK